MASIWFSQPAFPYLVDFSHRFTSSSSWTRWSLRGFFLLFHSFVLMLWSTSIFSFQHRPAHLLYLGRCLFDLMPVFQVFYFSLYYLLICQYLRIFLSACVISWSTLLCQHLQVQANIRNWSPTSITNSILCVLFFPSGENVFIVNHKF